MKFLRFAPHIQPFPNYYFSPRRLQKNFKKNIESRFLLKNKTHNFNHFFLSKNINTYV